MNPNTRPNIQVARRLKVVGKPEGAAPEHTESPPEDLDAKRLKELKRSLQALRQRWIGDRPRLVLGAALASLALALSLCWNWYGFSSRQVSTEDAHVEVDLYQVSARIMGYVADVPALENATVKKGDVLARLDDTDFKVELRYKEARYKKAEADLNRAKRLLLSHAASESDFENVQTAWIAAGADLEGTRLKLRYTEVVSPVDGIVARRGVQPGQFVQPGQSLFVIVPSGDVRVRANFKETLISRIQPGMKAKVEVDSDPGTEIEGTVESVFPASGSALSILPSENSTGNFTKIVQRVPVRILVRPSPSLILRAGTSANVTVILK